MFDGTGSALLPHVDTIAERATILGGKALGTGHLEALADRYGSLADALRQAINEAAGE